ncbi:CDF family Co(II)/Ni(II) efflux transporter DmeF [Solimonas terrae]|uniref:CDF family Co(II)/Ni(II) efflux transporter DmeF n=1 Tax=Solimonas terrae TaxID=1396819 RepID=A0A6M2BNK9_9GAMM|nr:CDF family Co(II)/Ni(II) efflux transporter DmeF [Solimonas terrae]NGY04058.1 CDF family Co(II)/Ni(II) efflux transporter DmeF [Solimonas terrae]
MKLHSHAFNEGNPLAENRTRWAILLTAVMMVAEITGGWVYNSMALLADGWHMSSHALALGLATGAYWLARRFANDRRFAFGTWKIEILGGFTSALLLLMVAFSMAYQSIERLFSPAPIHFDQAIAIAFVGLLVNLLCAKLLHTGSAHGHDHAHPHHEEHHAHLHEDLNLRSAYLHVLADAATSVLAIVALFGGKLWGANWLDPTMGIVGSVLVGVWAVGLLKTTGKVLLDAEMDAPVVEEIRQVIGESPIEASISDLHVWRVAAGKYACILGVSVDGEASPDDFHRQLAIHEELVHVTVQIDRNTAKSSSI